MAEANPDAEKDSKPVEQKEILGQKYSVEELRNLSFAELRKMEFINGLIAEKKRKSILEMIREGTVSIILVALTITSTCIITYANLHTGSLTEDKRYIRDLDKSLHSNAAMETKLELAQSMLIFDSAYDEEDTEILLILARNADDLNRYKQKLLTQDTVERVIKNAVLTHTDSMSLDSVDAREARINRDKLVAAYTGQKANIQQDSLKAASAAHSVEVLKPVEQTMLTMSSQVKQTIGLFENPAQPSAVSTDNIVWFKQGYYLLFFSNIKIYLERIDQTNRNITVTVSEITGSDTENEREIQKSVVISAEKPLVFSEGGFEYTVVLHTIDRAGKNPFTMAAYISCTRRPETK